MNEIRARRTPAVALRVLPLVAILAAAASSGCDIVTADFKARESAEWRRTYALQPGGRVEIKNVNGRIDVEPSTGNAVEVVAEKTARGSSAEAAKTLLEAIEIAEDVSPASIRIETKVPRGGFLRFGGSEVRYKVRVPPAAEVHFATVNGGIEASGLEGRITLDTTNGGIRARGIAGPIDATTTNGGVEVDVLRVAEPGIRLECTNGGIHLRVPPDARATISASVTNGGISTGGLSIDAAQSSRRRLEGRLNGGGPAVRLAGTNGGISISPRTGS